jgi:hypothetical protein
VVILTCFDAAVKTKYQALVVSGKPTKAAITAVMRRLTTPANALPRANRPWTQKIVACEKRIPKNLGIFQSEAGCWPSVW